jgi:hypothetical protein
MCMLCVSVLCGLRVCLCFAMCVRVSVCVSCVCLCMCMHVCVCARSHLSERPANVLVEGISIRDATTWSLAVANVTGARTNFINHSVCCVCVCFFAKEHACC